MSHRLYFLPILMKAVTSPDRRRALREAFQQIEEVGRGPDYREGYAQFLRFMQEATRQAPADEDVDHLAAELAGGVLEGDAEEREAALALVRDDPETQAAYRKYVAEFDRAATDEGDAHLELHRDDGEVLYELPASGEQGKALFEDVAPGAYELRSSLGRRLWHGELGEAELVWASAFPGQPLRAAADTSGRAPHPSKEAILANGEMTLRVFPGIERGRVEVLFSPAGKS